MFGIRRALKATDKLIYKGLSKESGAAIGRMITRTNPAFQTLGSIGRRSSNMSSQALIRSGRRRAMGLGAGAIVLNSRRTGTSTGATGRVNPRSSGGFA